MRKSRDGAVMLKDCNKASVYTMDGEPISDARVISWGEDYVELLFPEDVYEKLDVAARTVFYDGIKGLITCKCRLSDYQFYKVENEQDWYSVSCEILELESIVQRRVDCKVRVSFPMKLEVDAGGAKPRYISARAIDLSAGGIAFTSEEQLLSGTMFRFRIQIDGKELDLMAEILHMRPFEADGVETGEMRYGCRFVNLGPATESRIRKFVYNQQLVQIRSQEDKG